MVAGQGVGGDDCFDEPEPAGPAGEVVGDLVQSEPGGVGYEPSGWLVVHCDTVIDVANDVFDDGEAAVVGFHGGWSRCGR